MVTVSIAFLTSVRRHCERSEAIPEREVGDCFGGLRPPRNDTGSVVLPRRRAARQSGSAPARLGLPSRLLGCRLGGLGFTGFRARARRHAYLGVAHALDPIVPGALERSGPQIVGGGEFDLFLVERLDVAEQA